MRYDVNELLFGTLCIIADQIKIQKKTSKYKIVNWLYKKIYGYKYESTMPEGIDIVCFDNKIVFRNKEIFEQVNLCGLKILRS